MCIWKYIIVPRYTVMRMSDGVMNLGPHPTPYLGTKSLTELGWFKDLIMIHIVDQVGLVVKVGGFP